MSVSVVGMSVFTRDPVFQELQLVFVWHLVSQDAGGRVGGASAVTRLTVCVGFVRSWGGMSVRGRGVLTSLLVGATRPEVLW